MPLAAGQLKSDSKMGHLELMTFLPWNVVTYSQSSESILYVLNLLEFSLISLPFLKKIIFAVSYGVNIHVLNGKTK